jgi:arabinose-5-phosphate isomerase
MARPKPVDVTADRTQATIASALRTLEAEGSGVDALAAALRDGLGTSFAAAIDVIRAAQGPVTSGAQGRVIVTGMGKSGHIGRKIASTFASTGTPAFFVHPGEASHGDLGMIGNHDVILALSWSGETAELKNITDYSRRHNIKLIVMTAIPDSALAKVADVVLALPQAREACPHNLAPTTSSLMQLALGDALAIALLESHGFTAVDFGLLHPGGKLGTLLKTVGDIMHTGGLLVGIITDGDLRRHMHDKLLDASVEVVMTRGPKTVRRDQLLSETLDMLNTMKVTALFAIEDGKPIGIIHVHDLLRAGTA